MGEKDREQNESVILLGYANMSDEKSCMRLVCLMKHGIKREIDKSVWTDSAFEKKNTSKLMFRRVLVVYNIVNTRNISVLFFFKWFGFAICVIISLFKDTYSLSDAGWRSASRSKSSSRSRQDHFPLECRNCSCRNMTASPIAVPMTAKILNHLTSFQFVDSFL